MKKYKKIITGLILGLICAILPFVGVAKAKAAITNVSDLKNTSWILNEELVLPEFTNIDDSISLYVTSDPSINNSTVLGTYTFNNTTYNLNRLSGLVIDIAKISGTQTVLRFYIKGTIFVSANVMYTSIDLGNSGYTTEVGSLPRRLSFNNFEFYQEGDFLGWLQANATQETDEPTTRTIPFRISLITNVFGDELEYINSSIINLPVYDDTVSFTVSFVNNKMINGQIQHPESADELGELTFSNGERVFYTIYYNATNIEFKLYFYGEQLFLYEAVMYNTEVLDSGGNYLATVATYSEGISEQEMQTLKNSGIYEASFDITIPQEAELVTDAQLMLEIGILEGSEPPGFDNITNIMTGIFTLVSSFLSIQLGFITLGQIIGLILAIGVIFFIFYVWNGGRNGN